MITTENLLCSSTMMKETTTRPGLCALTLMNTAASTKPNPLSYTDPQFINSIVLWPEHAVRWTMKRDRETSLDLTCQLGLNILGFWIEYTRRLVLDIFRLTGQQTHVLLVHISSPWTNNPTTSSIYACFFVSFNATSNLYHWIGQW